MSVQATKKQAGPALDLSTWGWGIDWDVVIGKSVTDVIRRALSDSPPALSLDFQYKQEGDPLTLTIRLPFGPYEDDGCEWEVPLSTVVDDALEWCERSDTKLIDADDGARIYRPIAHGLRKLADRIDAKIAPAQGIEAGTGETAQQARSRRDESPVAACCDAPETDANPNKDTPTQHKGVG